VKNACFICIFMCGIVNPLSKRRVLSRPGAEDAASTYDRTPITDDLPVRVRHEISPSRVVAAKTAIRTQTDPMLRREEGGAA
jgi:hypothetical protein